jgi:pyridoxine 4-dehydrogenase
MTTSFDVQNAGTIEIAGKTLPRMGFGTMRLTGPEIMGEPTDRDECLRVVRAAYDAGVRIFDTAWYYGPDTSSRIVHEALAPYADDVLFVSKLGGSRTEDGGWVPATTLDELREGAERECALLGIDRLPVAHLRWMEIPGGLTFEAMLESFQTLQGEGLIERIGLSTITIDHVETARDAGVEVATVSNPFGPGMRDDDALVDRCAELGIPFLPYFSLQTSQGSAALQQVADEIGCTSSQVAIAWQLQRSPVIVPIPGTSKTAHLAENLAATNIALSEAQVATIEGPLV